MGSYAQRCLNVYSALHTLKPLMLDVMMLQYTIQSMDTLPILKGFVVVLFNVDGFPYIWFSCIYSYIYYCISVFVSFLLYSIDLYGCYYYVCCTSSICFASFWFVPARFEGFLNSAWVNVRNPTRRSVRINRTQTWDISLLRSYFSELNWLNYYWYCRGSINYYW